MPDSHLSPRNAPTSIEILTAQKNNNKLESLTLKIAGVVFTLLITGGVLSCVNIDQQNETTKKVLDILGPISFTGVWGIILMQAFHGARQIEINELRKTQKPKFA